MAFRQRYIAIASTCIAYAFQVAVFVRFAGFEFAYIRHI